MRNVCVQQRVVINHSRTSPTSTIVLARNGICRAQEHGARKCGMFVCNIETLSYLTHFCVEIKDSKEEVIHL